MPQPLRPLPAAQPGAAPAIASISPPPRPLTSTGAVRVLQNRRAPAQLSLFQRALPAR